jgi:hypothetical protein
MPCSQVITPDNAVEAECLIWENCQVSLDNLAVALQMDVVSVHNVVHKELGLNKVCAFWARIN